MTTTAGAEVPLRAGASRIEITPAVGCRLAGYAAPGRVATTIRDPLFARTLVIQAGGPPVAIVSLDAMAIEAGWVRDLRRRAAERLGLPPAGLVVAATHSHSAPGHLFAFDGPAGPALEAVLRESVGPVDHVLRDELMRVTLEGIAAAMTDLQPAVVRIGRGRVDGVAGNRNDPRSTVDDRCRVVAIDRSDGAPIATIVHFACHPTVLSDTDRGLSADFPGAVSRHVEQEVGGVAVFLNGALGDVSTRFTRHGRGVVEVERVGRLLGEEAVWVRAGSRAMPVDPVATLVDVALPAKDLGPGAGMTDLVRPTPVSGAATDSADGRRRQSEVAREGAAIAVRLAPHISALSGLDIEVQILTFGPQLVIVAVPLEVFSELGAAIGELGGERDVLLVGPANGYFGYLPTATAWDVGGYEVDSALVGRTAGDTLLAALRQGLPNRP